MLENVLNWRTDSYIVVAYYEELHSLYRSHNLVRVIKSIRLRCIGHVARMEEDRSALKILTDKPIGKRNEEGPGQY